MEGVPNSTALIRPLPERLNETAIDKYAPWKISNQVFERLQQSPLKNNAYRICELPPTEQECNFVRAYFMHQKPPGYSIKKIYVIHNADHTQAFEANLGIIDREVDNPFLAPKWQDEEPKSLRKAAIGRWREIANDFSPLKIKRSNGREEMLKNVKVIPLFHGTSAQVCASIASTNFTILGKHHFFNSNASSGGSKSTDYGYFGSGIYLTNSAQYAAMYSQGRIMLAFAAMREPYPVVNDLKPGEKGKDMKVLGSGMGNYQNYNCHYVPVVSTRPSAPANMEYYPCAQDEIPAWDEYVVFNNTQTLPRYEIELTSDGPANALPSPVPQIKDVFQAAQFGAVECLMDAMPWVGKASFLNKKNGEGVALLHVAVWHQQLDFVQYMLVNGANIDILADDTGSENPYYGYRPLHLAAKLGYCVLAKMLMQSSADVNGKGRFDRTPLHMATHNRHLEMTRLLISKGADVNAQSVKEGMITPLHEAVNSEVDLICEELLTSPNIKPLLEDSRGYTALYYAVDMGNLNVVQMIVSSNKWAFPADPNKNSLANLIALATKRKSDAIVAYLQNPKK